MPGVIGVSRQQECNVLDFVRKLNYANNNFSAVLFYHRSPDDAH